MTPVIIEVLATIAVAGLLYLALGYMLLCHLDSFDRDYGFHPVKIFLNWPHVLVILIKRWWGNRRTK